MTEQKEKGFELRNFGDFYYPPEHLRKNLEELVIFTENATKKDVPNGSVLVYNTQEYDPSILNTDVGCGITSVITGGIDFSEESMQGILRVIDEMGIHIGQGNHFLDFTTAHPSIGDGRVNSNMIYLHSDFNNKNVLPKTYAEAKDLERSAKEQRLEFLGKLTDLMGISSEVYRDWTHNSVNREGDSMVYRKGAINLNETDGVGALALNPLDGIFLYAGDFSDYRNSAQHGVGRIGSKGQLLQRLDKKTEGIARGYVISAPKIDSQMEEVKDQAYNSMDNFRRAFLGEYSSIGFCVPELVVTTKKSSS